MVESGDIFRLLDERKIEYSVEHHKRVYSIAEMDEVEIKGKQCISKNIVLTDDKKRSFYLLSIPHEKRLDLKALRSMLQSRPLSFLNAERMQELIGINKGEVTPFALLNDSMHKVSFILDKSFENSVIGIHPNDNSITVFLPAMSVVEILKESGEECRILSLPYEE